jgi:hypothetical protein
MEAHYVHGDMRIISGALVLSLLSLYVSAGQLKVFSCAG